MWRYALKRILYMIPVLIGVSFLIYFLMDLAPGDIVTLKMEEGGLTEEEVAELYAMYGLDKPLMVRYVNYMADFVRGDLGTSYTTGEPVLELYLSRVPASTKLALASVIVSVIISIPLGILAAMKHGSLTDNVASVGMLLGLSIPNFWLGLVLIILFALNLHLLPSGGNESGLASLILPAFTIGTGQAAALGRTTRSSMLDVLRQDYLRTARAKGCSERTVVNKHAFRTALIPISTIMFSQLGGLFGGAVTTEATFALPGVAQLSVQAIRNNDYELVTGCSIMTTTIVTVFMVLLDIFVAYIDPRVKAQYSK